MNGSSAIYQALLNDSDVVALVSTSGDYPCIAVKSVDPWADASLTTVLIYRLNAVDYTEEAMFVDFTVNCRASSESTAEDLSEAVCQALNRKAISGGGRFYCQKGFVIQPSDDTDNFNIPVEVRVKSTFDLN